MAKPTRPIAKKNTGTKAKPVNEKTAPIVEPEVEATVKSATPTKANCDPFGAMHGCDNK